MPDPVIEIEHLYKEYRLGVIGYGTLREDLQSWWARARGKEDPNSMLFSSNQSRDGNSLDRILALNDLNLTVRRGERLGIIGNNGAGKTTLLKILSRIASPTKGTARIKGRVASLIAVGTGFHAELTGRDNIYLNGSILGLRKSEIDQRFDEIVDFSGVEQFIDTPVKRYSSGMYVRLGFAVAAHLDPDVLIVDEVLAVGDAEFREKALGKMKDVSNQEDRTILFVSHNMVAIKSLCTRAILLESGSITVDSRPDSTVYEYLIRSTQDSYDLDLVNTKQREGNGRFSFTKLEFLDSNDRTINKPISGDAVTILFHYTTLGLIDSNSFTLDVRIRDETGVEIAAISTDEMQVRFNSFQRQGSIKYVIKKLPLRGGDYVLDLYASVKGGSGGRQKLDFIEGAARFSVQPGDYWNSGSINSSHSFFIVDGKIEN